MSKRPVIGVIPLVDYNKKSYWMLPGYFGGIIEAGGLPVMLRTNSIYVRWIYIYRRSGR